MTDITNILRNPLGMPEIELAAARHWGADEIESLRTQLANLRAADIHSCGPTCTRAGCVNVRLRVDVALLREALDALQDATSHIPGHHGPDVWRVVESARQALVRTKP